MTTLTVLCEGATEKNFVVKTLSPHLKNRNVFVKPIDLGGNISVRKLHNQINSTLKSGRGHEYVTTMIDLYGLGKFPGNEARPNETVRVRVLRIQEALFDEFPNPNFIPYIQLHEFEALVLVDTEKIRVAFPDGEAESGIALLNKSIGDTEPELVNESIDTAPSKRIILAIPAYKEMKMSAGPEIVEEIGLMRIRTACTHFGAWITRQKSLGK